MLLRSLPVLAGILVVLPALSLADTDRLTLPAVIQRALEVAPEVRVAEAEIAAREGELTQAGAWPNPALDARADDKLGQEDGRGGTDLTELALRQPIPLGRLGHQRAAAAANLDGAREARRAQRLTVEREAIRAFHALQHASAKQQLAEERLAFVAQYPSSARKSGADRIVRYLTPLERRRLSILQEEATQAATAAAREQRKALAALNTLLAFTSDRATVPAMTLPEAPASLEAYLRLLDRHPALVAARHEVEAARLGIDVARSQRYADPSLNLFRERDVLGGERRNVTGIGVSVEIPLWNRGAGAVAKAAASREQAEARLQGIERETRARVERSHVELIQLRDQAERLRTSLVEPAREVIDLTRRGFAAGEVNVLSLIDASNTYFDARARHLEMLEAAVSADADLRLAAGMSMLEQGVRP